jgi:hypothetical protein
MAFESFGGYTWSSGPPPVGANDNLIAAGKLALAAGVAGAGFSYAMTNSSIGTRPMDALASYARTAGNLSPFQLGNTFRLPEFLFPFTSPASQGLQGGQHTFTREQISSPETTAYLRRITGKSAQEMHALGLSQEAMLGGTGAQGLLFQAGEGARGSLHVIRDGQRSLLSDAVMLMSSDSEVDPLTRRPRTINRATRGVLQALDVYADKAIDPESFDKGLFASHTIGAEGQKIFHKSGVIPVPSISGPIKGTGDFLRRTSYARGVMAFEAGRFNDLLGGYAHHLFGETGERFFTHVLGIATEARPGPASALITRYAGKAALLGAAAIGIAQTDWMRRQFGMPGHIAAAAGTTAFGAYAAHKLGVNNRLLMMGSVASFFGQMVMPGFDQGLVQGVASSAAGLDVARGSALNPFTYYRRTVEGFLPGASSWTTGALIGVGAALASGARLPGTGKRLAEHAVEKFGAGRLGLPNGTLGVGPDELLSTRDMFWQQLDNAGETTVGGSQRWRTFSGRREIYGELVDREGGHGPASRAMNRLWQNAENSHREMMSTSFSRNDGMNKALLDRLGGIAQKYHEGNGIQRKVFMQAEGFAAQAYHSFFGADASLDKTMVAEVEKLGFHGITPVGKLGRFASIVASAVVAQQLITGGLLGSMDSSENLRDTYSGKKLVEVKKSRWWEGGGTPWEGGETSHFRPHELALLMNHTRQKGIWGADEDRISPLGKWIRKNFTYQLEEKNYYDRPYPISSAAFQDVPILGGLLSASIGRLFKPPKLMHVDEWVRPGQDGGYDFASVFQGARREPAYALGAPGPGTPISPFSSAETAKFLSYQFRELEGMTGWAKGIVQQIITGKDGWSTNSPVLADASMMDSPRLGFWEADIGGGVFTSELWRRIFPRFESGVNRTNPITNSMPAWMPDKFHYGDPYRSVEWGEARLPGAGYASLHPELNGVDPEEYPLIAKFAILADVAPSSIEFRRMQQSVYQKRSEGSYSDDQQKFIDDVDSRVAQQMNQYSFDRVNDRAIELPGSSITQGALFGAEKIICQAAAPAEYLTPMGFRPVQKLLGDTRDPIEQYEYERMYGTPMAFWDKPMRDWIRPSLYSAANMLGYEGKPGWRRDADAVDQKFDQLEFNKWMRLAVQAEEAGDGHAKAQYLWAASNTRMGVNPQGSALSIYWTLPESERSFFNSFVMAKEQDRGRILEMVPGDQAQLYESLWNRLDAGDSTVQAAGGQGVDENYLKTKYYNQGTTDVPSEDWIGWNQEVDLSDIKVKYADKYASDMADYGVWESQLKKAEAQPFLEGAENQIGSPTTIAAGQIRSRLYNMAGRSSSTSVFTSQGASRVRMNYNDHRDADVSAAYNRSMNGY